MIYGYFDESAENGQGFFVVAGYVGRKRDWKLFLKLWKKELGNRTYLHLRELRLGNVRYPDRHKDLLMRLGAIPGKAGLKAFAGSIKTSDYAERVKGTVAQLSLAGYTVALLAMVDAILRSENISKLDRIAFIFEDQFEFAVQRAAIFKTMRKEECYKTLHGKSRVGKDSAMAASMILEASDYLSYAILQQLVDPTSNKARLTEPILTASQPIDHVEITAENVNQLIENVYPQTEGAIPKMDRAKKQYILARIAEN